MITTNVRRNLVLCLTGLVFSLATFELDAGVMPTIPNSVVGPIASAQADFCGLFGGCCYGPAPRLSLFRGWRRQANCYAVNAMPVNCCPTVPSCGTGCDPYNAGYGYGAYGYSVPSYSGGCDSGNCGTGFYGYPSSGGGCSTGQCNTFYPPTSSCPVTPATPDTNSKTGGPSPQYDDPNPMDRSGTTDGFQPAGTGKSPAPSTVDPSQQEYIPPKVTTPPNAVPNESTPPEGATDGTEPATPPPPARPMTPSKRKTLGEDDEQGNSVGPRLELDGKVAFQPRYIASRQAQSAARVSANANRSGVFPRMAWRDVSVRGLAKK